MSAEEAAARAIMSGLSPGRRADFAAAVLGELADAELVDAVTAALIELSEVTRKELVEMITGKNGAP